MQEALTQQTALIQMSSYGLIGPLLAANAAVRQPVPSLPPSAVIPQSQQVATDSLIVKTAIFLREKKCFKIIFENKQCSIIFFFFLVKSTSSYARK